MVSHTDTTTAQGNKERALTTHSDPTPPHPSDTRLRPLLAKHSSTLPNWLYFLSFAPPVPSPFTHPKAFFTHPWTLYAMGVPGACISGVGLPAFDIVLGYWSQVVRLPGAEPDAIRARGSEAGWIMTIVGVGFIVGFSTMIICFSLAGAKLSNLLREQYLAAIIVQDQAFFDRIGPGEIVTRASKDINQIRTGLGERLGYLLWSLAIIIGCFVSAFVHAPKLAGVLFALIPVVFIIFTVLGIWSDKSSKDADELDGRASSLIEQILSSVRIVQSFDIGGKLLLKLENDMLRPLRRLSRKKSAVKAIELAAAFGAGFLVYSASFWYGGITISEGTEVGDVLTTFYNYVNLFFTFAGVVPHFLATSQAIQAIGNLRIQIERQPPIDVRDESGLQPAADGSWKASFELDKVTFAYPARPTNKALDGVSLRVEAGKFTALVGPSGSGKSTLASLLLRLYDPETASVLTETDREVIQKFKAAEEDKKKKAKEQGAPEEDEVLVSAEKRVQGSGSVLFAGVDIRNYNLRWLRQQVAVVLQNPQLISGTVFDNVVVGLTGTELEYRPDSPADGRLKLIEERVEDALRKAQAWDFVCALPDGMRTKVSGGRTGVLSGGQVQRIAIARALVRRPKVLLLDEATSAVSADAEAEIQRSLMQEQKETGMTLIVIAHRLAAVVAADCIHVMVAGQARYSGTYQELMDPECPDQTFRSMALVKQPDILEKTRKTSRETSESSRTLSHVVSRQSKAGMPRPSDRQPLPPPMRTVKEAFVNTRFLLTAGSVLYVGGAAAFIIAAWLQGRGVEAFGVSPLSAMRDAVNRWSLWFLVLTIVTFVIMILASYGLEYSGEHIVSDYRRESVRALLKQEVAYFEGESAGAGGLTSAVAYHPTNVGNVIGLILGQVIVSIAAFLGTLILAFSLTWRLAVMVLPALFFNTAAGYVNYTFQEIYEKSVNDDIEQQSNFVAEAANSIQMLAALTRERETVRQFRTRFTEKPIKTRWLAVSGSALAVSQGTLQLFGALIFYWGAQQVAAGTVTIADLFTIIEAVIVAVYVCARIWTYTGDFARMSNSLKVMQEWLLREAQLSSQPRSISSASLDEDKLTEGIEFKNVSLRYPSRPDVLALNNVSLRMEPSKSYAFCGTSGAGKSTILAVLQRFYETSDGSVLVDGKDIRAIPVPELRGMMGYVSQEAVLFEETVRWNLAAGALDPDSVTQADLEWACEQACILDFIKTLPEGFDTDLGLKGGQLSGGQRQRLCIARALIRRPKILLLDEATSALDTKSEAHVQQALENASRGRLTITVAHRLSTIRASDVIYVMEQGEVVEAGSHEELLAKNGRYFELVQAQL